MMHILGIHVAHVQTGSSQDIRGEATSVVCCARAATRHGQNGRV